MVSISRLEAMVNHSDNQEELTSWVKEYTKEMLSWAFHRTSDIHIAEDLVQETFLVATEKFSTYRHDSHPRTWLYAILNNKIAESYRMNGRTKAISIGHLPDLPESFSEDGKWKPDSIPLPWENADEQLFDKPEFTQIFERCLADLPVEWHACLSAKFLENRPAENICQELSLTTTNYWQIIHRAKLKMRSCLEQHWFLRK
jgi:RNA polymerase sigma-70 factor (ECF subfamily)